MSSSKNLKFALQNNLNVLLVGNHGIGKTTRPISLFKEMGVKFLFFNCPTMDVYEDLRGIPVNQDGKLVYIKPDHVDWQNCEVILLDEPNRAHPKVINSLYELIQFKAINGQKLPKLRAVWAAMNPPSEDYCVESLDQSFLDRFHCQWFVEAELSFEYLSTKYSFINKDTFSAVLSWWNSIPPKERDKNASPRRLDYALEVFEKGGHPDMTLPKTTNPAELYNILGGNTMEMKKLCQKDGMFTTDEAMQYITFVNSFMNGSTTMPAELVSGIEKVPNEIIMSSYPYVKNPTESRASQLQSSLNKFALTVFQDHMKKLSCNIRLLVPAAHRHHTITVPNQENARSIIRELAPALARSLHID